jgi:hypothetical protein
MHINRIGDRLVTVHRAPASSGRFDGNVSVWAIQPLSGPTPGKPITGVFDR